LSTWRPYLDHVTVPTSYHHGDLRRTLLAAARETLERDGHAPLSLRELARAAGVSHNAPYRHFADREALLDALCADGFSELVSELHSAVGDSAAERLAATGQAYVRFADRHPGLFTLMFQPATAEQRPLTLSVAQPAYQVLSDAVEAITGTATPVDVTAMWAVAHGLATLRMTGMLPEQSRAAVVRDVTARVASMLASTSASAVSAEPSHPQLVAISPFFIVKNLQASVAHYITRFGFTLDFQGPPDDVYYARVQRNGVGIMLKEILPDVMPVPNHTRHAWARWDAYIYTHDPDGLFAEFVERGASFVKELSFIDDGLWGFEVMDADGYVVAFFRT
jgi:AcrR family transcriptional regulator